MGSLSGDVRSNNWVQIVDFRRIYNTVDDGTGLRTRDRVNHQPVTASVSDASYRGFRKVIFERYLSIIQEFPQVLLLVDTILDAFAGIFRQQKCFIVCCLLDPRKEGVNEMTDFIVTLPLLFFDHHMSYAASSYCFSGFEKSLVFAADCCGEKSCTSLYIGSPNGLKR